MTKQKKITLLLSAIVIIALLATAFATGGAMGTVDCPDCDAGAECDTCGGEGAIVGTWWALLPPIIAIGLALITKEVYSSLFIGILSGSLLAANFSVATTLDTAVNSGLIEAVAGTAGIFVFLVDKCSLLCRLQRRQPLILQQKPAR